jgi:fructose-1,6-bisphosphatase I
MAASTLDAFLSSYERAGGGLRSATVEVVRALAGAALKVRRAINSGAFGADRSQSRASTNSDGDLQQDLDIYADEIFLDAARHAPVAWYASEELATPVLLDAGARLALAIDPLDGSSNIDANVTIGTIFSLLPATGAPDADPAASFLQPGHRQLAAGSFIYGPQFALILTLGAGTHCFVFSTRMGAFVQAHESLAIAHRTQEFAINASNYRHWDEAVRLYIDDCLKGSEGPREKDFNMRWVASLIAEAYRILVRGGVFLYPGDQRPGYGRGRLRLVYEANPIAMLIEQAGGGATDTVSRILDIEPRSLHERVPLVFGAAREVDRIARYHTDPSMIAERSPLFGNRGLFRA